MNQQTKQNLIYFLAVLSFAGAFKVCGILMGVYVNWGAL